MGIVSLRAESRYAPFVLSLYPLANYPLVPPIPGDPSPSPGVALGASGTDGIFVCPERNAVQLLSQNVTTYAYEFNDENAPPDQFEPIALLTFPFGAYHFAEVQYLFNWNERFFGANPFTPEQQALSNSMISYWTNFATDGDPNSASQPVWSPYNSATDQFQSLVPPTPLAESTFDSDHKCSAFWSSF